MFLFLLLVSTLNAALVSRALEFPSISSSCNNTLSRIASDDVITSCMNLGDLAGLESASSNSAWITQIDRWLDGFCSRPQCSNETLEGITNSFINDCSQEISALALPSGAQAKNISELFADLPAYQQGFMCLSDVSSSSKWCITDALTRVKDAIQMPLNAYSVILQIPLLLKGSSAILSPNTTCTDCSLATYALARQYSPLITNDTDLYNNIVQHCGRDFVGEGFPFNVQDHSYEATARPFTSVATMTAMTAVPVPTSGVSTSERIYPLLSLLVAFNFVVYMLVMI